jgi:hypothetical protein
MANTEKSENPVVHMKCRRGNDAATRGQACQGMQAEKLTPDGSNYVQLRCTSCKHVWTVPVGGSIAI